MAGRKMVFTKLNLQLKAFVLLLLWSHMLFGQDRNQTVSTKALGEPLSVRVYLPPNYDQNSKARYPSLYLNDGQDAEAVGLAETLERLYREKRIAPVIVIAIPMLPDRMGIYGYSDRKQAISLPAATRFGPVGAKAHAYSEWLALSLVPEIDQQFRTIRKPEARTVLGWSLGAANAFNIGWNYPDVFGRVGGFSPAFWLSAVATDPSTAIVRTLIEQKPLPPNFSMWLAAGDTEETSDRDGDGIIDVVDDAQGVIDAVSSKAMKPGSLDADLDIQLIDIPGGRHEQATWKRMLPDFLIWAYPVEGRHRRE
jgi:enterochelin esterase-like enzyme